MRESFGMLPRFLVPDLDPSRGTATVTAGEAHHLTRVLRLGPGDDIAVFDGRGAEFRARIDSVAGGSAVVRLSDPIVPPAERRVSLTLAQAVLKGTSMDDVVRDATMMGVAAIVPLITTHTVARKAATPHGADRWRRVAIASAKQCRRARIPDVADALAFDSWLRQTRPRAPEPRAPELPSPRAPEFTSVLLLVEPSLRGVDPLPVRALAARGQPPSATLAVGPEGGWAMEEVQAAVAAGHTLVTLGPLTLRAEAVALAALAALTVVWD
jgi:16S rRNA (uracil1498-N3)-methyltransferase